MQKVVLWVGPASYNQIGACTIPDADKFIQVVGGCPPGQGAPACQGSNWFSTWAEQYNDGKRYFPKFCKSKGIDITNVEFYVGSFSAGHGALKKFLMDPDDRALVQTVALADSTYCGWPNKIPQFSEGYVRMCVDAVQKQKLFVATASAGEDPAGNTPAGYKCMLAIKDEVEKRTGQTFTTATKWPSSIDPQPLNVYQLGSCILADYGSKYTHPEHASKLAPQVWSQLVVPWLQKPSECLVAQTATQGYGDAVCSGGAWGGQDPSAPPEVIVPKDAEVDIEEGPGLIAVSTGQKLLAFGAGAVAAYFGLRWAGRKLEEA